jgi:hypothetical protein
MSRRRPTRKKKRESAGVVLAAIINGVAIIFAAFVTGHHTYQAATAAWQQTASAHGWVPKDECERVAREKGWLSPDEWKRVARENNWIPKGECPWQPVVASGRDESGKQILVQINILAEEYRWQYGSSTEIELNGKPEDLPAHIRSLDISTAKAGIVCVGTASVEGARARQQFLANERAEKLLALLRSELKPKVPLYALNLGRFKGGEGPPLSPKETAPQRRVIVVEILGQDEGVKLDEAVYNALIAAREDKPPIAFDVRDYYERDFYRARL